MSHFVVKTLDGQYLTARRKVEPRMNRTDFTDDLGEARVYTHRAAAHISAKAALRQDFYIIPVTVETRMSEAERVIV